MRDVSTRDHSHEHCKPMHLEILIHRCIRTTHSRAGTNPMRELNDAFRCGTNGDPVELNQRECLLKHVRVSLRTTTSHRSLVLRISLPAILPRGNSAGYISMWPLLTAVPKLPRSHLGHVGSCDCPPRRTTPVSDSQEPRATLAQVGPTEWVMDCEMGARVRFTNRLRIQ